MLMLYYFNWAGTREEFKEYLGKLKSIADGIDGIDFKGVFTPTSEWHYVLLYETTSYGKGVEAYRTYMKKYGRPPVALAKVERLHTLEELGITP